MKKIYKFSGYIREVEETTFSIILEDETNPDNPDMHAVINICKIRELDQKYIKPGAPLVILIRHHDDDDLINFVEGKAVIKFIKRFWKQEEIDQIKKDVEEKYKWLREEENE
ncbi:MAG: hypothetical protein KAS32_28090 [Candidatus Peribacteraceae bacterium]|nr:hypothetical protein [Candidatus Peribacteraceae bacterium]